MLKKNTMFVMLILLMCIASVNTFAGGDRRNGTGGAQELLLPVGARGLALNGANVAGLEGIEAIFYNPAGLGVTKKSAEALFSHQNYIADIGISYAAVSMNFEGFGSLAFSIKTISFGDIPVTTVENPEGTGSTFSPAFFTTGITYSNALTDRIRVGVTINLISEKIVTTSASGVALNAGVQYNGIVGLEGLKLGVVLKNIGPQMKFDGPDLLRYATDGTALRGQQFYKIDGASFELPSQLELGMAYEKSLNEDFKGLISTSFANNNFSNDEYKFGAEVSYNNTFFLRGGYLYTQEGAENQDHQIFGPTFGAGFNLSGSLDIAVDYAYKHVRYFDANHVFSIRLGF